MKTIEGVRVRLTSPVKTVADCFRYRQHVGLDVAPSQATEKFSSLAHCSTPDRSLRLSSASLNLGRVGRARLARSQSATQGSAGAEE